MCNCASMKRVRFPVVSLSALDLSGAKWYPIAVSGSWSGYRDGETLSITESDIDSMVRNSASRKTEIPVYYEHADIHGGDTSAAGWIIEVRRGELEGSPALLANIQWTQRAMQKIDEREFKYFSPTIIPSAKDRVTGKDIGAELFSGALTNNPFLEELPEITLGKGNKPPYEEKPMNEQQLRELCEALGINPASDAGTVIAFARRMANVSGKALGFLGLSREASDDSVAKALSGFTPSATYNTIVAERDSLLAEKKTRESAELVAQAMTAGKITAVGTDMHTWALSCAAKQPEVFKAWLSAAPRIAPESGAPFTPAKSVPSDVDALSATVAAQLGLTIDEYKKFGGVK